MKLATNIRRVNGNCWKSFKGPSLMDMVQVLRYKHVLPILLKQQMTHYSTEVSQSLQSVQETSRQRTFTEKHSFVRLRCYCSSAVHRQLLALSHT